MLIVGANNLLQILARFNWNE